MTGIFLVFLNIEIHATFMFKHVDRTNNGYDYTTSFCNKSMDFIFFFASMIKTFIAVIFLSQIATVLVECRSKLILFCVRRFSWFSN